MSNTNTNQNGDIQTYREIKNQRAIKWLAITGVLSIIIFFGWIMFSVTGLNTNLMATLGSIFGDEETYPVELILTPPTTQIEHGQPATLEWEPAPKPGTYALWFDCANGMQIDIVTPDYGNQEISCETFYNIGEINALRAVFSSTESESQLIDYKVAFVPDSDPENQFVTTGQLTVQNSTLAISDENNGETDTEQPKEEKAEKTEEQKQDNIVNEEGHTETATTTPEPTYIAQIVYQKPTSDPLGNADISLSYRGVGVIDNNTFTAHRSFNSREDGAIRFSVTNHGTRTSSDWTYTATLPNGQIYTSPTQEPLKPNETATISLGFKAPIETGIYPFSVEIDTVKQNEISNNRFSWSVEVE